MESILSSIFWFCILGLSPIAVAIFNDFFRDRKNALYDSMAIFIDHAHNEFYKKRPARDFENIEFDEWVEEYIQTQTERFNQSKQNQNNVK